MDIVPAGLLNRIAFNALPVNSNTYLIDKYHLRQFSSVREIAEIKVRKNAHGFTDAVFYGGIDFDSADSVWSAFYHKVTTNKLPDNVKQAIRGGAWNSLPVLCMR